MHKLKLQIYCTAMNYSRLF